MIDFKDGNGKPIQIDSYENLKSWLAFAPKDQVDCNHSEDNGQGIV